VIESGSGRIGDAGGCPTIRAGIVSSAGVRLTANKSTPYNHFAAGPHRRVPLPAGGRIDRAGGCPTIRAGIVSPASVAAAQATPDDHFTAGPHRRVIVSGTGRVGRAGGCPAIRARIVSPAGVRSWEFSTPNDHFTAGPHRRVFVSTSGRVDGAGRCPSVVNASARPIRYSGQCVVATRGQHYITNPVLCSSPVRAQHPLVVTVEFCHQPLD
jgi:hypothetical protein